MPTGWTAPSRAHATHKLVAHDLAVESDGTVHLALQAVVGTKASPFEGEYPVGPPIGDF